MTALIFLLLIFLSLLFASAPIAVSVLFGVFLYSVLFLRAPKQTLFFFLLFLLFQRPIAYLTRWGFVFALDEVGVMSMTVLMTAKNHIAGRLYIDRKLGVSLAVMVFLGSVGTVLYALVPLSVALGGLLMFIKGFLLYYVISNMDITPREIGALRRWLYVLAVAAFVYAVFGALWPRLFVVPIGGMPELRFGLPALQGFLGHPGSFSAFMGIMACGAAADALLLKQRRYYWLFALFLAGTVFSLRRTTFIGVIAALGLTLLCKPLRVEIAAGAAKKIALSALLLCAVFSGILFVMYKDLTVSYLSYDSPRARLFVAGLRIAADYFPFGSGFGTYSGGMSQKHYSPLYYDYRLSHLPGLSRDDTSFINDTFWPHVLAEVGVIGFICYVYCIYHFFVICFRSLSRLRDPDSRRLALTALLFLVLSLVESTKATFYEITVWVLFYFGSVGVLRSWKVSGPTADTALLNE